MGAVKNMLMDINEEFYKVAKREPTEAEVNAIWEAMFSEHGRRMSVQIGVLMVLEDGVQPDEDIT